MRLRSPRKLRPGEEATLVEHLDELRVRMFIALGALGACSVFAYVFHHRLLEWLNAPLPERLKPTTLGVAEPFLISIKVSLFAGFGLALPIVLWQTWAFFAPAVNERAQRQVVGFVGLATALLVGGALFGYFLALPASIHYLTNYDKDQYNQLIQAKSYYSFEMLVLGAVALVFELPVVVVALVRIGILTTTQLRRNRRIGYFVVACLAVALPGVDPVTTVVEGLPLVVLYELSIWLAVLLERRARRLAAEGAAPA